MTRRPPSSALAAAFALLLGQAAPMEAYASDFSTPRLDADDLGRRLLEAVQVTTSAPTPERIGSIFDTRLVKIEKATSRGLISTYNSPADLPYKIELVEEEGRYAFLFSWMSKKADDLFPKEENGICIPEVNVDGMLKDRGWDRAGRSEGRDVPSIALFKKAEYMASVGVNPKNNCLISLSVWRS